MQLSVIVFYLIVSADSLASYVAITKHFTKCLSSRKISKTLSCTLPPTNVATLSSVTECASYCAFIGSEQEITFENNYPLIGKTQSCYGFNYKSSNGKCQLFDQPCLRSSFISFTNIITGVYYQVVQHLGALCDFRDCNDVPSTDPKDSGVYRIVVDNRTYPVYCQISQNGTKYIVTQRRMDGSVNFYRNWNGYENGFGSLTGEYWLGNYLVHRMTNLRSYKLRIELETFDGVSAFDEFANFTVGSKDVNYTLEVSGYSGTAGDSMSHHNAMKFTTYDADNDKHPTVNCAVEFRGAWWYTGCYKTNLNGYYYRNKLSAYSSAITYLSFKPTFEPMKITKMLIAKN